VTMRRRGHGGDTPIFGLSAVVAVMMNALGALIVIVIYMALSARGFTAKIATPLISATDKKAVIFECRENTVFKPDIGDLQDRTLAAFSQCVGSDYSRLQTCENLLATRPVHNAYYSTKAFAVRCPGETKPVVAMTLQEVPGSKGESLLELQDPDSVFHRELAQLDPQRVYVFFYVRGDSFAVFQSARKAARKLGFRAGWEPFERKTVLGSGCGGGQSGFRQLPQ